MAHSEGSALPRSRKRAGQWLLRGVALGEGRAAAPQGLELAAGGRAPAAEGCELSSKRFNIDQEGEEVGDEPIAFYRRWRIADRSGRFRYFARAQQGRCLHRRQQ